MADYLIDDMYLVPMMPHDIGTSRDERMCETCDYCVYLGEGDFACDERDYEYVIENWVPLREPCEKYVDGDAE